LLRFYHFSSSVSLVMHVMVVTVMAVTVMMMTVMVVTVMVMNVMAVTVMGVILTTKGIRDVIKIGYFPVVFAKNLKVFLILYRGNLMPLLEATRSKT
jgi:hypothetical protein